MRRVGVYLYEVSRVYKNRRMNKLKQIIDNYYRARFAYVTHHDNSRQLVSILITESDGNIYLFSYPYITSDIGFSCPPQYVKELSIFGKVYTGAASYFVRMFPNRVCY